MSDLSPTEIRMRCIEAILRTNTSATSIDLDEVVKGAAELAAWIGAGAEPVAVPRSKDKEAMVRAIDEGAQERHRMERARVASGVPDQDDEFIAGHSGER